MDIGKMKKRATPFYDRDALDNDVENPNAWDKKVWKEWLDSIDCFTVSYCDDVVFSKDCCVKIGHRGIRIVEKSTGLSDWYYNIEMGYKK
jgi:hypothetical protein